MFNFIEQFYYGNLEPQECSSELTAEMKKKLSQLTKKEECLNEKLADELKDLFADYTSSCTAFTSVCCDGRIQARSKVRIRHFCGK